MKTTKSDIRNTLDRINKKLDMAKIRLVNLKAQQWKLSKMKHRKKKESKTTKAYK